MVNPVFLILAPLSAAFALPLVGFFSPKLVKYVPIPALLFNSALSLFLLPRVMEKPIQVLIGGFPPPFSINLTVGPVGIILAVLISLVGLLVSVYSLGYIREGPRERYHALYLLLLTGATGVVLTGDIFNLFVFFEILCISSYALVAYRGDKPAIEAAIKYLIQGAVGSSLALIGIGLLYGLFGTLNMADIAARIDSVSPPAVFVSLALMVTGFGVEAAVFPLNSWLPDAHSSAPSSISAILSGIAIEVGLYAVIRLVFTVFGASGFLFFLALLGILTLLIGELAALSQDNIKRMLAYSSIGQIGLILFALSLGTAAGVSAGLFQLLVHTLSKALLFLAAGYLVYRSGSLKISSLNGLGKKMPFTALAFSVGAFSLVGLPPFMGFGGKFLIIRAALARGETIWTWLIGLVLLATIIEGAYFFRVVQALYFKKAEGDAGKGESPLTALIPFLALAALILALGIYPRPITGFLKAAAAELLQRADYIRGVLG
jgi:proton-translocating NADH-quinone oxidoreductase chain N